MCLGTATCVHHLDPAVQWLERDYEHMYEFVDDEMAWTDGEVNETVLMDSRNNGEWYEEQYAYGDPEEGNSTETPQPMFTIKRDWFDDEGMTHAAWRWSAFEGPCLPYEPETAGEADERRDESYPLYLLQYMSGHGITPTDQLLRRAEEIRERYRREAEERAARYKAEADARRALVPVEDRPVGLRYTAAVIDESYTGLADSGFVVVRGFDDMAERLETLGLQLTEWQARFFRNAVSTSEDQEDKS